MFSISPLLNPVDGKIYDTLQEAKNNVPSGNGQLASIDQRNIQLYGGARINIHQPEASPINQRHESITLQPSQTGGLTTLNYTFTYPSGTTTNKKIDKYYWSYGGNPESRWAEILQPLIVFGGPIAGFILAGPVATASLISAVPPTAAPVTGQIAADTTAAGFGESFTGSSLAIDTLSAPSLEAAGSLASPAASPSLWDTVTGALKTGAGDLKAVAGAAGAVKGISGGKAKTKTPGPSQGNVNGSIGLLALLGGGLLLLLVL